MQTNALIHTLTIQTNEIAKRTAAIRDERRRVTNDITAEFSEHLHPVFMAEYPNCTVEITINSVNPVGNGRMQAHIDVKLTNVSGRVITFQTMEPHNISTGLYQQFVLLTNEHQQWEQAIEHIDNAITIATKIESEQ